MNYLYLFFGALLTLTTACRPGTQPADVPSGAETAGSLANPAAPGFNLEGSDPQAVALADSVMLAMGGRTAWDATRYLRWTFFGRRTLLWDKQQGRVRISMSGDTTVYLLNLKDKTGKVKQNGVVYENPDSLAFYLDRAESIWINDSYWLVMPFKLKDSGVTLKYLGRDTTQAGEPAEVLELTFQEVGRTPDNKYQVCIHPENFRVTEWRYFRSFEDPEPAMITPWADYQQYGAIYLSGERGRAQLTNIAVFEEVPAPAFTSLEPVSPENWQ